MGNTTSFYGVTNVIQTGGGLLMDANAFSNMTTHGPLTLSFDTVWAVDAGDAPVGPYMPTSSMVFENVSGKWSGPEGGNYTWWLTWIPEVGDEVKYTHVPWLDMNRRELEEFQHGFSASLKKRLDGPGAIPLTRDAILAKVLDQIEEALGYDT